MKVAGIQADLVWENPLTNFARIAPRIAEAARGGARLVALPEMFPTGFSLDAPRIAEPERGPGAQFLRAQARTHGVTVVGSVATRPSDGGKAQNLGMVASPDGSVARYAKIHPFSFGGESEHYRGGDAPLTVTVEGVRTTLLICYDLRFPELFAALADRTDLFVVIASWPTPRREHWVTLLKARAIECVAYVMGCNRVGSGGGLDYLGDSVIFSPSGDVVADADPGVEAVFAGEIDAARVAELRRTFPVLADRRPSLYRSFAP
ncbi:MAG: nitrilase-related carbon-nitrogen hydrolase [Acidobacteriota bacterium]